MSEDRMHEELAARLFEAGRGEESPPEGRARLLAALGIDGPSGGGGDGSGSSSAMTTKVVATLGLAGLVVLGVWLATRSPKETSVPVATPLTAPPSVAATAPTASEVPEEPATPAVTAAPSMAPPSMAASSMAPPALTRAERTPAKPTASAAVSALPSSSSSTMTDDLAAELAALDRARKLVRAGNSSGALAELDAYQTSHPRGALGTEALLLRVEALMLAGKKDEARKVAGPLLDRKPGDMTGDRARRLLER